MRYIECKGCEHSVEVYMVVKGCRKIVHMYRRTGKRWR